jgi:hypothetical protein
MKTCTNIKAAVLRDYDGDLTPKIIVGLKWDGDKWGLKGEGATVEEAVAAMATEFYAWLTGDGVTAPQAQSSEATASPSHSPEQAMRVTDPNSGAVVWSRPPSPVS